MGASEGRGGGGGGGWRGVGGGGGGGEVTLFPAKITQFPKAWVLFKRTQIAVKTKTFTRLMKLSSFQKELFWNLAYSMTSINSLVHSETYKRNS